jgi:hypothetical protein
MEMNRQEIPEWLKESMAADRRYAEGVCKEQNFLREQIIERIKPIAKSVIQQEKVIEKCFDVKISNFCIKISQIIFAYKKRLEIRPTNAKIVDNIERINKLLEKTINELRLVSCFQYYLSDIYGAIDNMGHDVWDETIFSEMPPKANQAKNCLLEVKALLEEQKRKFPVKRGRTDADDQGFVTAICFAYDEFIGEPTGYEEGPFFIIVTIALDIVGRPSMDPSRSIEKALAALRKRQAPPTKRK